MESEIKKYLSTGDVVFVFALPESGRSYQLHQIADKNNWCVVDLPEEKNHDLSHSPKVIVVNSLDSITTPSRLEIWKKLVSYYHQNIGQVKFVLGQGCEDIPNIKEILGGFYLYYFENRVWLDIKGNYWPLVKRSREMGDLKLDKVVETAFAVIWDSLTVASQKQLLSLIRGQQITFSDYILKTGLVTNTSSRWTTFSPLFTQWLKNKLIESKPNISNISGKLILNREIDLESVLSFQEYQVLSVLYQHSGEIVSRDTIANILWSKDTEENYSNWSIDKIISRIRKKIGDVGKNKIIKTIKGVGFIFSQE